MDLRVICSVSEPLFSGISDVPVMGSHYFRWKISSTYLAICCAGILIGLFLFPARASIAADGVNRLDLVSRVGTYGSGVSYGFGLGYRIGERRFGLSVSSMSFSSNYGFGNAELLVEGKLWDLSPRISFSYLFGLGLFISSGFNGPALVAGTEFTVRIYKLLSSFVRLKANVGGWATTAEAHLGLKIEDPAFSNMVFRVFTPAVYVIPYSNQPPQLFWGYPALELVYRF